MKKIITILYATCMLTVFFISAIAQVSFAGYQEKQTKVKASKVLLKNALSQIERKYGVNFIYIDKIVVDKAVSEFRTSNNLEADLKKLLSPSGLGFKKINDKQITIFEISQKETEEKTTPVLAAKVLVETINADRLIKGKIVSSDDATPLEGATVTIKGTNRGAITNNRGEFQIMADDGDVLEVNYVGFEALSINVNNQRSFNLSLVAVAKNMEQVTVIGSRSAIIRTNVERPVPVDVFSSKDIVKTGQTELAQMIHFSAPSFNSTKHGISNVTSYVDPATLRGLGPDQTLVLVNGKRRHQSAALNVNNVVGRGTVGTDLNVIPTNAIERVEILRNGAAAQYGSDAIAGIVNLQLKRASKGGSVNTHYGKTKQGDGETFEQSVNFGLPLGKKGGFFNTTLEAHHKDPTDRSTPFNGRVYNSNVAKDDSIIAARNFNRQIAGTKYGTSKNTSGIAFYNAEIPLQNNWAVYSFGGYSYKAVTAYGFFRPPSNAKRAVLNIYPNGYAPVFPANLQDVSSTLGFKRTIKGGWNMDFSNNYGQNYIKLYSNTTVNPSHGESSPTSFYGGALVFGQNTTNADFSKSITTLNNIKSLNLSFGAEYRREHYEIKQGDNPSWKKGRLINTDVGASGREGFADVNAVKRNRNNFGVYADVESDISDSFYWQLRADLRITVISVLIYQAKFQHVINFQKLFLCVVQLIKAFVLHLCTSFIIATMQMHNG